MPVMKELQDIVDELGNYDRQCQLLAVRRLLVLLDAAEEKQARPHFHNRQDRLRYDYRHAVVIQEQRYGKEAATRIRDTLNRAWQLHYPGNFYD